MTRNQKLIKNTGNWILIIILLLLCGILVFHLFSFTGMSHRLFAKQIQKVVLKEDAILQQAKQNHQTLQDLDNLPNTIGAYVYNRDSLLYWNSNVIDPDLLRKRVKMDCDTIVNLNVGDFLVTSFEKDSCSFFFFKLLNTTYPIENKYFVNRFQPIWGKHKVYFDANPQPESYQITTQTGKLLSNCSIEFPSGWGSSNLSFLIVCVALMILCFYLLTSRFITRKIIDKTESHTKPTKKSIYRYHSHSYSSDSISPVCFWLHFPLRLSTWFPNTGINTPGQHLFVLVHSRFGLGDGIHLVCTAAKTMVKETE